MTRTTAIGTITLLLASWPIAGFAATADIVLQSDDPGDIFIRSTDNNAPTPATTPPVRLDRGDGTSVTINLDDNGNYNLSWRATDPVDPPTKSKSGSCSGQRDDICHVDLSNATPLPPPPAPAPAP